MTILNDGTGPEDVLNEKCGADFVKVGQKAAKNFEGFVDGERCASIDGDADRLVYFYTDKSEGFVLLDGDKIATLSEYIKSEQSITTQLTTKISNLNILIL